MRRSMENKKYKIMRNTSRGIQVAIDSCAGSHVRLKQMNKDLKRGDQAHFGKRKSRKTEKICKINK